VRVDRGDDLGDVARRLLLDHAHVELDDVGAQEGHQRQRAWIVAHVVERDAPGQVADGRRGLHELGGAVEQRALRDLDDAAQIARGLHPGLVMRGGLRALHELGLGVEEHRQRRGHPRQRRPGQRRVAAGLVELAEAPRLAHLGQERQGRLEGRAGGAPGQGLEPDRRARGEVDDGLEDGADRVVGEGPSRTSASRRAGRATSSCCAAGSES
jgi:hypothetical protein